MAMGGRTSMTYIVCTSFLIHRCEINNLIKGLLYYTFFYTIKIDRVCNISNDFNHQFNLLIELIP